MDRPGVLQVAQNLATHLDGIENPSREDVIRLMERDMNSAAPDRFEHEGIYQTVNHMDENRRRSSPFQYIRDTLAARNDDGSPLYPLTLSTRSLATKVLFSEGWGSKKPKAVGVEYIVGERLYQAEHDYDPEAASETRTVAAKREVIIAGGAFNTPQILKLSGVGPREELEEHGIPVVADLPAVGEYLRDNYEAGVRVEAAIPWENNPAANCRFNPTLTPEEDPCLAQWMDGYGPYGQASAPIFMLMRTEAAETSDADLILFAGASVVFDGHFPGFSRQRWPAESLFVAVVDMQSAEQNGYVRLRSGNPRHQPEIHLDFYPEGSEADIRALSEGVERMLEVLNNTGAPYQPFTYLNPPPGVSTEQSIRDHSWSHHVTSSCRMGPADDPDYCVDSKFRVNGVDGLRVVDGSVFPISPGGFPGSSTATISRKAFYDIIEAVSQEN